MKKDDLVEDLDDDGNFGWLAWLLVAIFMALLLLLCGYYWVLLLDSN